MLRQIWQWLKRFFQGLFGVNKQKTKNRDSLQPLSDTDYEFLFTQLLEGVIRGWDQKRVLKFFEQLEDRATQYDWINWLEGFGGKVLAGSAPNQELGIRMIRFGQLTEFLPSLRRFGQESYELGQQILNKQKKRQIWEYTAATSVPEKPTTEVETPTPPQQPEEFKPLTPDQLLARLYQDQPLAEALAKQLDLEGGTPEQIVAAMVNQMVQLQNKYSQAKQSPTENVWLKKALEQFNQGDLEGAISSWDQALKINPYSLDAWYNRGGALSNLGRHQEALNCFEKIIEIKPDDYMALNSIGNILYRLERWEDALNAWNKLVTVKPDYYQGWYNRACALEHLQKLPEAIASYQKALEIKPDFSMAESRLTQLNNSPISQTE
ncbi:MAG: tetratricopeptide repeat protein [Gloeocapsa sp. DLM2.Bin57]|nr:MAG: tetratricopeptide repeat protein [Gloeocapsa sp. DLM2.Bin57]